MRFADISGQKELKEVLVRSVREGRIAHAQLFLGPEGNGGLAMARAYAAYILCENRGETDSCGECPACRKAYGLIHPDLHWSYPVVRKSSDSSPPVSTDYMKEWREYLLQNPFPDLYGWLQFIEAGNKQGNITVRECQEIIRKLNFKSFESSWKILIMWLPEYLGNAGNVLLKLIEEPPENTVILLAAHDEQRLLGTIRSRTQLVRVNPFEDRDLEDWLKEKYGLDPEEAAQTARLAEGNIRDAIQLAGQETGGMEQIFRQWMNLCYKGKAREIIDWVEEVAALGREQQKNLLRYALHYLRESMAIPLLQGREARLSQAERKGAEFLAESLPVDDYLALSRKLDKATYYIERNANSKILFLNLSLDLAGTLNKTRRR